MYLRPSPTALTTSATTTTTFPPLDSLHLLPHPALRILPTSVSTTGTECLTCTGLHFEGVVLVAVGEAVGDGRGAGVVGSHCADCRVDGRVLWNVHAVLAALKLQLRATATHHDLRHTCHTHTYLSQVTVVQTINLFYSYTVCVQGVRCEDGFRRHEIRTSDKTCFCYITESLFVTSHGFLIPTQTLRDLHDKGDCHKGLMGNMCDAPLTCGGQGRCTAVCGYYKEAVVAQCRL